MFDTATYLEAITPPVFRHTLKSGRVVEYVGRFLSIDEWLTFQPRLLAVARGEVSHTDQQVLLIDVARAIFPPTFWQAIRGLTVSQILLGLPVAAQGAALSDFCNSQLRALGVKDRTETPAAGSQTTETPEK